MSDSPPRTRRQYEPLIAHTAQGIAPASARRLDAVVVRRVPPKATLGGTEANAMQGRPRAAPGRPCSPETAACLGRQAARIVSLIAIGSGIACPSAAISSA